MKLARLLVFGAGVLAFLPAPVAGQQDVAGMIVDARSNRPIEGVSVTVQGAGGGVRTDARGRFRFADLSETQVTLRVAALGYRPVTQVVTVGETNIRIALQEQAINLDEIVVTGTAGDQERRALGNSATSIRAAEVQERAAAPDISSLINTRAPGVVVIPGTGQVGAGPRIRIRGMNGLSLNDQPLIYVDGVRVVNDVATGIVVQAFGSGVVSRLNDINPDMVDRIEIIKGPAAATLYGTEAANGVIQIFTKRGQAGERPRIGLSVRQGTQWFMNPEGRLREPINRVCPPGQTTDCPLVAWNAVRQEDSLHALGIVRRPLFTNGYMMGYSLNLSGGTDAVRYFLGGGFDKDQGIEPTNAFRRLSTTATLNVTPGARWDVQASVGFIKSKLHQAFEAGAGGIWFSTLFGDPKLVRDSVTGVLTARRGFLFGPPEYQWGWRQASQLINRFTGSVTINHRTLDWLSQRLTVGQDQTEEGSEQLNRFLPPEWIQFNPGVAALGLKFDQRRAVSYLTVDYSASAKAQLNENLASTSTFGAQFYRRRADVVWAQGERFPSPDLETIAATAIVSGFEDFVENSTVGMFGQQQFAWGNRLYLTAALRVDDNSAFGKNFNLVVYPKVSASYVVAEDRSGNVNDLRLRGAYGQSGQQPDSFFAALRSWQPVTGGDGLPALIPQSIGNPDLAPERSSELELGFEAGLFNERLAADVTFYYAKTRDAILFQSVAPSTGFPGNRFINIGAIRNLGFEAKLGATPIRTTDVSLRADFGVSHNSNRVLDLGPGVDSLSTFGPKEGYPVDAIFVRKVISADFDPVTGRAINVLCASGPGGRTGVPCNSPAASGQFIGVWDPTWEGSLSSTLTLLGRLQLYALIDFKLGNRHFDNNLRALCQVFLRCNENFDPASYDILRIAEIQSNNLAQSWVHNDASFAKLREVSLSYALPPEIARRLGSRDATLLISARNLHTWTQWSGLDPESYFVTNLFTRLEQDQTPQLASFQMRLNLTF
jgi:TonB-linked SusC/RagA family outer membrane protein